MVTSTAEYLPADSAHSTDLVVFGGGYTLYALNPVTGALVWSKDYTGNPDKARDPGNDQTRILPRRRWCASPAP